MKSFSKRHLLWHLLCYLVSSSYAIYLLFIFNSYAYGWQASALLAFVGLLLLTPGLPFVAIMVQRWPLKFPAKRGYLLGGLLLGLPLLAGLLPGRVEEAIIGQKARPLIAAINAYQQHSGRLPKGQWTDADGFVPARLPPHCYYASWQGDDTYYLIFARPTWPDSAVIYNSQRGWTADD